MIWNPWREIARLNAYLDACKAEIGRLQSEKSLMIREAELVSKGAERWHEAFENIIAEERPTSNATVRRMAKIARVALGK